MATPVSKFNPAISDTLFNIYTVFSLTRLITSALHSIFFTAVCSDSHSSLHKFANISAHSVSLHLQFFFLSLSLSLSHTQKLKKLKYKKIIWQDCCCVGLNFSPYHQRILIRSSEFFLTLRLIFISPVSCYFLFLRFNFLLLFCPWTWQ